MKHKHFFPTWGPGRQYGILGESRSHCLLAPLVLTFTELHLHFVKGKRTIWLTITQLPKMKSQDYLAEVTEIKKIKFYTPRVPMGFLEKFQPI